MKYTGNYNLKKPDGTDVVNIQDLNDNMDIIDTQIKSLNDNKVQKETGKGLSSNDFTTAEKNKLSGIAGGANNYVHPATHPPSIIAQDANNRFVTDAEKANWNAKASTAVATQSVNGLMSSTDKKKLDGVQAGAQVNTVVSVNGKTGAVNLSADDVGAIPKTGGTFTGPINIPSIFLGDSSIYLYEEGGNFGLRVGKSPNYSFFAVSPSDMWFGGNKIWHAGNDGIGSGLDADMLDGWHVNDIIGGNPAPNNNLNSALDTGLYSWNTTTQNKPPNAYGVVRVIVSDGWRHNNASNWIWQIAYNTDSSKVHVRRKVNNGNWTPWEELGGGGVLDYKNVRTAQQDVSFINGTNFNTYYTLVNVTGEGILRFVQLSGTNYSGINLRLTVDGTVYNFNGLNGMFTTGSEVNQSLLDIPFKTSVKIEFTRTSGTYYAYARAQYMLK